MLDLSPNPIGLESYALGRSPAPFGCDRGKRAFCKVCASRSSRAEGACGLISKSTQLFDPGSATGLISHWSNPNPP